MNSNLVKIGSFLKRSKDAIEIKDSVTYKRITIKTKHQGILLRDVQKGSLIGTKLQFKVKSGQFLLSKIDARFGAFGIVPNEVDGGIITGNFWTYDVDKMKVNIEWLNLFTSSLSFYDICDKASSGTTHRKYLDEKTFLNFEVKLPSIEEQNEFILWYNIYSNKHKDLSSELDQQRIYLQFLRQAILQEAVQGKLTPQVETDEPASELLKRIKAEKQKLIKEGKLKKEKELLPIREEEIPFELPKGWVWCKIGDISFVKIGSTPSRQNNSYWDGNINWVSSGEVANNYITSTKEKITERALKETSVYVYPPGTVLIAMIGQGKTRGQTAILNIPSTTNQNVAGVIIEHGLILSEYLWFYFLSCYAANRKQARGGNQPALNGEIIKNMLFPLPPFSEQQHVVAKVKQLTQYIDKLEQQLSNSQAQAQQLMQAVLKEAFVSDAITTESSINS